MQIACSSPDSILIYDTYKDTIIYRSPSAKVNDHRSYPMLTASKVQFIDNETLIEHIPGTEYVISAATGQFQELADFELINMKKKRKVFDLGMSPGSKR